MSTSSRTLVLALLCAFALMASACGAGGSDSAAGVSADDESGQASDADAPATSLEAGDGIESPIAELLGIPIGDGDAADEYFDDLGRQAEILVAECMLAQGFQYQVVDHSQFDSLDVNIDFESREFAEEYGFGIASNPFGDSFEALENFVDPNQEYTEALTEGEREAYELALNGEFPESPDDFDNFEPGGCQNEAFEEVFSFGEVFEQFGDAFDEIEQAYEADPRIVGAATGWSGCMSEAGHSYSDQDGATSDIRRRFNSILSGSDAFAAPAPSLGEDGEPEIVLGPQSLNSEAQAQVDELAVQERAIAVASWECNQPLREIEDEVRLEYEQRFVDENGAAIREALGE